MLDFADSLIDFKEKFIRISKSDCLSVSDRVSEMRWNFLLLLGLVVRLVLIGWSVVQDNWFRVRYTDVDYFVFSDAARLMFLGQSPYDRPTYRYTPLIAFLFVPNELFGSLLFGKLLLVVMDLATSHVLLLCCHLLGYKDGEWRVSIAYLFNPLIINITTRGNSEAITILLLACSLLGLLQGRFGPSAVCLGIATHVRLFPVLNGVPIALFLLAKTGKFSAVVYYGMVGALTVGFCTLLAFFWCGYEYLHHAVLYHASRVDHRHSLSLAFPSLYLSPWSGPFLILPQLIVSFIPTILTFFRTSHPPQHKLVRSIALQTAVQELQMCVFLIQEEIQVLVACSRVLTVQYFAWWLPFVGMVKDLKVDRTAVRIWISCLGLWLGVAYCLEFLGATWAILVLQLCGSAFFLAQMNLIASL